jgi:Protein of unknown function (DUF3276)
MAEFDNNDHQGDIFAKAVRAGKRTYFFDVRATRSNDYYLTITESKKRFNEGSDRPFFEKHKIFLYKEDFEKFSEGLKEAIEHIRLNQPAVEQPQDNQESSSGYSDVNFDDLGK